MDKVKEIYDKLYNLFGPQDWWPVTSKQNPIFEIIIGAILTQNTNWKNVEKAIFNLSKERLISIEKIKKIDKKRLADLIRPAGYYNQKAERLKTMADFLSKNPIKKLRKENKNKLRKELLKIKGIGAETADSILLYAFNKPIFVIDAYTKRIFHRLKYKEKTYDELQRLFMSNLPKDYKLFNEYHALLVELGKNYCKNNPNCIECPIKIICRK